MTAIDGTASGVPRRSPDPSPSPALELEPDLRASDAGGSFERVSLAPASAYEAVTRQMVLGMREELREIKARLNGLLFMVAGSVLLELVTRVIG